MCKSILKYIHCHPIWRLLSTIQQRQHSGHRPSVQSLSTLSADCSSRLATHQSVGKMTWSEVGEQVAAAKWICIASTKECLQTVNRPNTVLEMIPGTEVTLLSESEVDFAFDDGQFVVQKKVKAPLNRWFLNPLSNSSYLYGKNPTVCNQCRAGTMAK